MCPSFEIILPYVVRELGSPTITFVGPKPLRKPFKTGDGRTRLGMKKRAYFDTYWTRGWPELKWLEPYFLGPTGRRWIFETGNDGGGLTAEGVDGTEHLDSGTGRIDLHLTMIGNRDHGVLLQYLKL